MKAQKLKSFTEFLRRSEIIPHALLVITEDDSYDCSWAILELKSLNYDIPFYELNLTENSQLKEKLLGYYDLNGLPTFLYFRGKEMLSKIVGFDGSNDFRHFLSEAVQVQFQKKGTDYYQAPLIN